MVVVVVVVVWMGVNGGEGGNDGPVAEKPSTDHRFEHGGGNDRHGERERA